MSLIETCWWTLLRAVVLCLAAWPLSQLLEKLCQTLRFQQRAWFLLILLGPSCFPELLVGYAYRDWAMAHPRWAESLCSVLLLVRMVPIGTIALLAAPRSALDNSAIYCRRLMLDCRRTSIRNVLELARCYWQGPVSRAIPALTLMGLVAFQEFELAALLQTMSWTDWFVTAQRFGLDRVEMFRQATWPLLWQFPVLLAVFVWLTSNQRQERDILAETDVPTFLNRRAWPWGAGWIACGCMAGCLIPAWLIGWRTLEGFESLLRQGPKQSGLFREIASSIAVASCSGLTAWTISGRIKGLTVALVLPGLFGSLLLSLGCVGLFQTNWLHPLYDTPVPWVCCLTLWLLPRALILRLWLHLLRDDEAIYTAELLNQSRLNGNPTKSNGSPILWSIRDQPQFLAASLLCYWAYCDLPTAYLLAPTGMASGLVRLYNFMHFGRSAALSAESVVFFGLPVAGVALVLLGIRQFR